MSLLSVPRCWSSICLVLLILAEPADNTLRDRCGSQLQRSMHLMEHLAHLLAGTSVDCPASGVDCRITGDVEDVPIYCRPKVILEAVLGKLRLAYSR